MRGVVELFHPAAVLQDLARLGTVGWTDDAILLHKVDQASGPAVADPQPALQRRSGSAPGVANHTNRILVKVVVNVLYQDAIRVVCDAGCASTSTLQTTRSGSAPGVANHTNRILVKVVVNVLAAL